ncbi:MAG: hypothetical protein U0X75_02320 [Acidobacteriota bacterium]
MAAADVLVAVNRPADEDIAKLKKGALVISFLRLLDEPLKLKPMIAQASRPLPRNWFRVRHAPRRWTCFLPWRRLPVTRRFCWPRNASRVCFRC